MTESYAGTYYPQLREVLDPRYSGLSDRELEEAFADAFGEGTPAEYEEFFGGLGRTLEKAARQVGRVASAAGPGILRGAAAGSALGPFGALGGALLGGTGSALQQYGGREGRGVGAGTGSALGAAGMLAGRGGTPPGLPGPATAGAGSATSALLALLGRPEWTRALAALASGSTAPVAVGQQGVPVRAGTFAGLLGALARQAGAEWTESVGRAEGAEGEERAGGLLRLLAESEGHGPGGPAPGGGCGCGGNARSTRFAGAGDTGAHGRDDHSGSDGAPLADPGHDEFPFDGSEFDESESESGYEYDESDYYHLSRDDQFGEDAAYEDAAYDDAAYDDALTDAEDFEARFYDLVNTR
ncbi:hypothetical protein [Streptomyces sp. NRRL S-87]|uniref:hypothetical protein n=1 Tax=Streptomyces sp. NRRL S-87 TaxID=1463920 RepID=UPI0004C079FE|nr:hypothetical protein [Streptomyces sp. NRRL S-87]